MKIKQIPSVPMPESGQLWLYVDEPECSDEATPLTILDVTDNVVYYTPDEITFEDGQFSDRISLCSEHGMGYLSEESFTFRKGIPSKILLEKVTVYKLRLDLFQKEYHCISVTTTVYEYSNFEKFMHSFLKKIKSRILPFKINKSKKLRSFIDI
jgi:hypothetical protein